MQENRVVTHMRIAMWRVRSDRCELRVGGDKTEKTHTGGQKRDTGGAQDPGRRDVRGGRV